VKFLREQVRELQTEIRNPIAAELNEAPALWVTVLATQQGAASVGQDRPRLPPESPTTETRVALVPPHPSRPPHTDEASASCGDFPRKHETMLDRARRSRARKTSDRNSGLVDSLWKSKCAIKLEPAYVHASFYHGCSSCNAKTPVTAQLIPVPPNQ